MSAPALRAAQATFLLGHRVAHLATVGGTPPAVAAHVLPVCFALFDGVIYIPLDAKPKRVPVERLRRVQDISRHPAVSLLVDDYDEDWSLLHWLQIRGTAALLQQGQEQPEALAALRERYEQYRRMDLEGRPLLRITPLRAIEWRWSDHAG